MPAFLLLTVSLSVACTTTAEMRPAQTATHRTGQPVLSPDESGSSIETQLRAVVHDWDGTPHRMGGSGREGIDCSGFVQRVYRELFGIRLPRTTRHQVHAGRGIRKDALQAGDLVFFRPPYKIHHVGIYLGNGQFAHASTAKGVTISSLKNSYWRRSYWTARRIFPGSS